MLDIPTLRLCVYSGIAQSFRYPALTPGFDPWLVPPLSAALCIHVYRWERQVFLSQLLQVHQSLYSVIQPPWLSACCPQTSSHLKRTIWKLYSIRLLTGQLRLSNQQRLKCDFTSWSMFNNERWDKTPMNAITEFKGKENSRNERKGITERDGTLRDRAWQWASNHPRHLREDRRWGRLWRPLVGASSSPQVRGSRSRHSRARFS